jgi:hypothetical protein
MRYPVSPRLERSPLAPFFASLRRAISLLPVALTLAAVAHIEPAAASVTLTWLGNSWMESGYLVERGTTPTGPFTQIGTTGPGGTAFTDDQVVDQAGLCYRVRAFNAQGYSDYSNVACSGQAPLSSPSDLVNSFFQMVLSRTPAPDEAAMWMSYIGANCNAAGIAGMGNAFFDSQEFRTSDPRTLIGLVTDLYVTLLRRAPDPAGQNLWTGEFRAQRVEMAAAFIASVEFQSLVPDRTNPAFVTPVVARFYTSILGRDPDPAGLQAWVNYVVTTQDLNGTAETFLTCAEFESRPLTFRSFVEILYMTFLGRQPDPSGWDAWESVFRTNLMEVIDGSFASSAEFATRVSAMCGG